MRSGTPFTVGQTAQDIAGVGDVGFGQPWSETGTASINYQLYDGTPGSVALDTSVFVRPANGTFGNSPRNAYYNPGEMQWDLALFKNFSLGGARRLQLRAEAFNFLNHPNLGGIECQPAERQLRPHHEQGRQPPRRAAERAVPVLGSRRSPSDAASAGPAAHHRAPGA